MNKNAYSYYIETIKPLEKKYNRMCTLYEIFKLKYFKKQKTLYNKVLLSYYKVLQNNIKLNDEIIKNFQKFI